MLGAQGLWAERNVYCVTLTVTRGLSFFPVSSEGLSHLVASCNKYCNAEDLFLPWILTGELYSRNKYYLSFYRIYILISQLNIMTSLIISHGVVAFKIDYPYLVLSGIQFIRFIRGKLLTKKLMLQGYNESRLKSSFRKFYGRYNDLVYGLQIITGT
jgi:hypothetical protein